MKYVLSVDDDLDFCNYLESLFKSSQVCFLKAHSVAQAKQLISETTFDVILLDRELPDGTGIEVAKFLREGGHEKVGLALITSSKISIDEYHRFKSDLNFDIILSKPFVPKSSATLVRTFSTLLEMPLTAKR